ncbi:MAG: multidrug ABC transporter permease [Sphingomonadales bacterium CG12_big_fil_rev_8_21_14_0_65_65_10]|uniref:ABC transporter permease n=1 Tax=Blastomonas marina TaxID=1867408 RepID=UPI000CA9D741|nr:ABC transporter permease [Blastomonas marina]PIW55265.1 MAG: multidrug ABC transporter permease [Sphingomonadales bacterium CG12_big_fil_rev_8_21_14_0_65_65_10]WPZ02644.1 ABC transporter permease [Blastomonas marina]
MSSQPENSAPVSVSSNEATGAAFPERGVPQIGRINRRGLWTLYMKEVRRFFKVQTQTIWAPALTTLLFLVIFTVAFGRGEREILGVNFATFVAPGLIAMGMMNNAFANSSFGLLVGKIQGTIVDYLMPPLSEAEMMLAIVGAAMTRAILVGGAVALAMAFYPGVELAAPHPWAIVWFGLMGALLLSFAGLITSMWAEKFDHNAAVTNFIISPLTLLSGTFYTIQNLAPLFQAISRANPFFYVISGFRYGFLGQSDIGDASHVAWAALGLLAFNAALGYLTYRLLKSGWKIRS